MVYIEFCLQNVSHFLQVSVINGTMIISDIKMYLLTKIIFEFLFFIYWILANAIYTYWVFFAGIVSIL